MCAYDILAQQTFSNRIPFGCNGTNNLSNFFRTFYENILFCLGSVAYFRCETTKTSEFNVIFIELLCLTLLFCYVLFEMWICCRWSPFACGKIVSMQWFSPKWSTLCTSLVITKLKRVVSQSKSFQTTKRLSIYKSNVEKFSKSSFEYYEILLVCTGVLNRFKEMTNIHRNCSRKNLKACRECYHDKISRSQWLCINNPKTFRRRQDATKPKVVLPLSPTFHDVYRWGKKQNTKREDILYANWKHPKVK